jgi:hypothetical protein
MNKSAIFLVLCLHQVLAGSLPDILSSVSNKANGQKLDNKSEAKKVMDKEVIDSIESQRPKLIVLKDSPQLISEFSISQRVALNCNQKYLPIEFYLKQDEVKIRSTGYLDPVHDLIHDEQLKLSHCKKIQR